MNLRLQDTDWLKPAIFNELSRWVAKSTMFLDPFSSLGNILTNQLNRYACKLFINALDTSSAATDT